MEVNDFLRVRTNLARLVGSSFVALYYDKLNRTLNTRAAHPKGDFPTKQDVLDSLHEHPHFVIMEEVDI